MAKFTPYSLQYIVFRLDLQKKHRLTDLETKVVSFIHTYLPSSPSGEFYFSNKRIAELFTVDPEKPIHSTTISKVVSSLERKGLITTTLKASRGRRTVRYIRLGGSTKSESLDLASTPKAKTWRGDQPTNNKKNNKYVNVYYYSEDSELEEESEESTQENDLAMYLAESLDDLDSLNYYKKLASLVDHNVIHHYLSLTLKAEGVDNPPALFVSLMKQFVEAENSRLLRGLINQEYEHTVDWLSDKMTMQEGAEDGRN